MSKNIICKSCGFENKKEIKIEIEPKPKIKKCNICKEEYQGTKKKHNESERHDKLKELCYKLSQIPNIENSNIDLIINGILKK